MNEQFIPQVFEAKICDTGAGKKRFVKVITYTGKRTESINHVEVEVTKDVYGSVSFIVKGYNIYTDSCLDGAWILRTSDFNRAYDVKCEIEDLLQKKYSKKEKTHVLGELKSVYEE